MARLFGVPSLWLQRSREAEGSARVFGTEMILNVTRRVFLLPATSVVEPGAGKTHRQAMEHAQNGQGPKGSNSAAILMQAGIQSLVQLAFNAPVLPATLPERLGAPWLGIGAGDHGPGFTCWVALGHRAAPQFTDLCRRHKADLFRAGGLQPPLAPLLAAAVGFLAFGAQGFVRRGKKTGWAKSP